MNGTLRIAYFSEYLSLCLGGLREERAIPGGSVLTPAFFPELYY